MKVKTHIVEFIKFLISMFLIVAILSLCSGVFFHANIWLAVVLYIVPSTIIHNILAIKNPEFLKKRKNTTEDRETQKKFRAYFLLAYYGMLIVSGLDIRFGWSCLPKSVIIIAAIVMLVGQLILVEALRENHYAGCAVKKQENQKLIDTGIYGLVRHPLYLSGIITLFSMPLVIGSIYAFLITLTVPFIYAMRIKDEEVFLEEELEDYKDYKKRVKYRLIPFIW